MRQKISFFSLFLLFTSCLILGQNIIPLQEGPIHEAYLTPIKSIPTLTAIPLSPPQTVQENIPPPTDERAIWIPGYWDWDEQRNDFKWITGVYRIPPPGLQWIPTFWSQFSEGWARIPGFWSQVSKDQLRFIEEPPPEQWEEDVSNPSDDNYFWRAGYWAYFFEEEKYEWVEGQWEPLDPNWVLVPAHYRWRPEGYVFIPEYWDYPLAQRGQAYSPVFISPAVREGIVFDPIVLVEPIVVIRYSCLYYPDYLYLCHHHYHYYPYVWVDIAPPWWAWPTWWTFSWHDHWGVWWWYTHPGFPQPEWISADFAQQIAPPSPILLGFAKKLNAPYIVTPNGVVSPKDIFNALEKGKPAGKKPAIIPGNIKQLEKIQNKAAQKSLEKEKIVQPSGKITIPKPGKKPSPHEIIPKPSLKAPLAPAEVAPARPEKIKPKPLPKKPLISTETKPKKSTIIVPSKPIEEELPSELPPLPKQVIRPSTIQPERPSELPSLPKQIIRPSTVQPDRPRLPPKQTERPIQQISPRLPQRPIQPPPYPQEPSYQRPQLRPVLPQQTPTPKIRPSTPQPKQPTQVIPQRRQPQPSQPTPPPPSIPRQVIPHQPPQRPVLPPERKEEIQQRARELREDKAKQDREEIENRLKEARKQGL